MKTRSFLLLLLTLCVACAKQTVEENVKLSESTVTLGCEASSTTLNVASDAQWTASSTQEWLTVTPASGSGNGTIQLSATANVAAAGKVAPARVATVSVAVKGKSATVKVNQAAEATVLTVLDSKADMPMEGGTFSVRVERNTEYSISFQAGVDWVSQIQTKSSVTDVLNFHVEANTGLARSTTITFKASGAENSTVEVNQAAYVYKPSFPGEGTEASPYLVSTAAHLVELTAALNNAEYYSVLSGACIAMTDDINMDGVKFTPFCQSSSRPFKGVFDGRGHSISNLVINSEVSAAAGLFAYTEGAKVKNVKLVSANVRSKYVYCGAIVGYAAKGTVIDNVSVSGSIYQYTASLKIADVDNSGLSGGLVGALYESSLNAGTVDADVSFYGKFSGGVVGDIRSSSVTDCHFLKKRSLNIYYHFSGGVIGRAKGDGNVIKSCSFEGEYTTVGYVMGGIVGQLGGGRVEDCVFGSYGNMGGDKNYVGGIVGSAQPEYEIVINRCACYGTVKGQYCIGGIVGYVGNSGAYDVPLASATKPVTISNCASVGASITATGGNSSKYPIAGGIVGWIHGTSPVLVKGCFSTPGVIQTTYGANAYGVLSGICSYSNGTGGITLENCYSAYTSSDMLVCNDKASDNPERWYAGIVIRCTQPTTVNNCYSESSMRYIYSSDAATVSGCGQYSIADMTGGALLSKLQQTALSGTVWVAGGSGYPTIQGLPADPNVKPRARKRISVIGDSISTFKGWIPGSYSAHYPATDGTLVLVKETYWYRLIYDYMKDAEFDTNIAFSGSTVTNTTAANYAARYGTASNAWWHNSFVERFAACGGCGNPDIILIHGGTNDWAHNADPLAPGVAIRNDASNIYGGNAPSATIMNSIYTKADAAKTRAEINALPDGTFCEAYVKLLCQIRERYPKCKVVCIIGDYLSQSVEQSVILMAEKYGAKTVNLFRVNGFNDLGGYSPETLKNKGKQPNMPKHDYSGDVGGCHPGSECMKFMAEKIYKELGAWLEE